MELAGVVASTAVVTGAVVGTWVIWLIKKSWLASAGAFIAGAVFGFLIAQVIARVLYRTANGNTAVVKIGSASLSSTIPAGLAGGVVTAIAVGLVVLLMFGGKTRGFSLFGIAIGCGVVIGILLACLGSLA
ncbi:MAG: hypothetical protein ABSG14_13620 [Verrucomicrobiia bacterium]